jgi:hypothetical protein
VEDTTRRTASIAALIVQMNTTPYGTLSLVQEDSSVREAGIYGASGSVTAQTAVE